MRVIAFVGPSLPASAREPFPSVEWRAPAEAGDLLALEPDPSLAICLVDGYFDHRPAVRHKEILLLLAEGVRIYGASSIGAIRAAEMSTFGMVGVGGIYRAYADGRIVGDDEVALVHATAEWDWRPLSVPLVDVRATCCRAVRDRILAPVDARRVLRSASAIHYVERSWELILACAPLGAVSRELFRGWLAGNSVVQKILDASACIKRALESSAVILSPPRRVQTVFLAALARERGISLEGRI